MKERTTRIKGKWRNFKTPQDGLEGLRNAPTHTIVVEATPSANPFNLKGKAINAALGKYTFPGAAKYHNNQNNVIQKFTKQTGEAFKGAVSNLYGGGFSNERDRRLFYESLTSRQEHAFDDFSGDIEMSNINLSPAVAGEFSLDLKGDRRIATQFARIISKIAEDYSGPLVEGNSVWDMNKLIYRKIDNRNIVHCKGDKEKQSVVLILDSSPSCSRYVDFYSEMAVIASKFDDIDMYDAPNARLVHRWNSSRNKFERFLTLDDVCNDIHKWKLFKNRVILFFGDFDGYNIVLKNSPNNRIFYFGTEDTEEFKNNANYFVANQGINCNLNNITYFPQVRGRKAFIKAMKTIR